jgi:hypothetical protein
VIWLICVIAAAAVAGLIVGCLILRELRYVGNDVIELRRHHDF